MSTTAYRTETVTLGRVGEDEGYSPGRVILEIEIRRKETVSPHLNWDLEETPRITELSIVGHITGGPGGDWQTGGQMHGELRRIFGARPEVAELCDIWEEWHLNGMVSGTRRQMGAIQGRDFDRLDWYGEACKYLEKYDLLEDRGYKFGSAWLCKDLPPAVMARLREIIDTLKETEE